MLDLALDARDLVGLLLALTRVGGFVVASPLLARVVPLPGRLAVVVTVGLFLASPPAATPTLFELLALAAGNAVVGLVLGFLTGVLFQLFAVAGGLVDLTSGLAVAALFDPTRGEQAAVFARLFSLLALALFFALGGLQLLVRGLALSVAALPLDAGLAPGPGLADTALELTSRLLLLGTELALPVLAALFLVEVVLGLASRLAPQANVFLLGIPAKLLLTLAVVSSSLLLFPGVLDGLTRAIGDTFADALRALGA